jgi:hypothetical protein
MLLSAWLQTIFPRRILPTAIMLGMSYVSKGFPEETRRQNDA